MIWNETTDLKKVFDALRNNENVEIYNRRCKWGKVYLQNDEYGVFLRSEKVEGLGLNVGVTEQPRKFRIKVELPKLEYGYEYCSRKDAEEYQCVRSGHDWDNKWCLIRGCCFSPGLNYLFRRKNIPTFKHWDKIPAWHNWVAKEYDVWFSFGIEPRTSQCEWKYDHIRDDHLMIPEEYNPEGEWEDWTKTLIERPVS